jgi:dihydropteroate synthase
MDGFPLFSTNFKAPQLMGILNVTTDSFSDGGKFADPEQALTQAQILVDAGADILDVGGESTRPGALPVPVSEELRRVLPVLLKVREKWPHLPVSVDTRNSAVAEAAIDLGATYINDISALSHDPRMAEIVAARPKVKLVLMHMRGQPETMQADPVYANLLAEISSFFAQRIEFAVTRGIDRANIILDPGIGFGKTAEHNFRLLAHLGEFRKHGLPLLLGVSRKRFIASVDASGPQERIGGTLAAAVLAAWQGVDILRVHDVREHRQFFAVLQAIGREAGPWKF